MPIQSSIITIFLFVQSVLTVSQPLKSPPNPHLFSGLSVSLIQLGFNLLSDCHNLINLQCSVQEPWRKSGRRLSKPLIRDDGRVYCCSERNLFAFESNGSIAWSVNLNYSCNVRITPVHGGSRKVRHLSIFFFVS